MLDFFKTVFSGHKNKEPDLKKRGNEYLAAGDLVEAEGCYRQYIKQQPNDAGGYVNLGFVLNEKQHFDEAEHALLKAIELDPKQADAYYLLGLMSEKKELTEKAIDYYQLAINANPFLDEAYHQLYSIYSRLVGSSATKKVLLSSAFNNPTYALAQYYAGCIHLLENNLDVAIDHFNKAVLVEPDNELHYFQLGNIFRQKGEYLVAADNYRKAIAKNPKLIEAYRNLGFILQQQNKFDEAISVYQKAIEVNNTDYDIFNGLGAALYNKNDFKSAIDIYKKAITLNPNFADTYSHLARAFNVLHNFEKAIINYEKAFQLGLKTQDNLNKIASALRMQGKFSESIEKYRQALMIPADDVTMNITHSNLLFTLTYCKYAPTQYLNEATLYGERVLSRATPYEDWFVDMSVSTNRPLRIGLVSADLRGHPVGLFIHGLLTKINANRLQVIIYSNANKNEDVLSARIKSHALAWHNISGISDVKVAKQIRDDLVDVLIDLSGHTGGNRLPLFAWQPAPVQITWLGYWASTGVPGIDYLLADKISIPIEESGYFSEKVHYLPDTRMCLESPRNGDEPDVSTLPAISNGYITFGSFQNVVKMNKAVLTTWSKLLAAIPTARLRLQSQLSNDAGVCEQLLDQLLSVGIECDRVTIKPPQQHRDYLASYGEIDIVLDTFPFPGGTTTCEALWMGVPTVTLAGETMIARQGASMLTSAGLKDWVANTEEEYVSLAIKKASDLNSLASLRNSLREQVRSSPLCNAELFAQHFENAIFEMWKDKIRSINA
jgi:protein O-GlcNAc transferase